MKKSKKTNTSKSKEDQPPVKNPHNNFVVKLFERTKTARRYLKSRLPEEIVADVDWRTLKASKVSWVDDKLKAVYSDINFTVKWKGMDIYLPVVIEHQSYKPRIPQLKMMRYLLNGYDYQLEQIEIGKQKGTIEKGSAPKLTVIIPLFLYHGKEKWEYRPFHEFFHPMNEHIIDFIPNFKYLLDNLSIIPNEELFQQKELGLLASAFLLLKNYQNKDYIVAYSAKIIGMAKQYEDGSAYFQFFAKIALTYIATSPDIGKTDVETIINSVDETEQNNPFMNAIREYQLEAAEEAEEKKSREVVLKLLGKLPNLPLKEVAEIAGVSLYFVRKVKKGLRENT